MAPPPKHLITRKLVKRFFDNYLPKEPAYAYGDSMKMFECWQAHGFDSSKCKEQEMLFDHVMLESEKYRQRLKSFNFKSEVLQTLKKPLYPKETKGRYRKRAYFEPRDVFDGVY